jgi:hypothetical protein
MKGAARTHTPPAIADLLEIIFNGKSHYIKSRRQKQSIAKRWLENMDQ